MQIGTNPGGAGATALVFYQGPTTSKDPNTGLHPTLLYVGELFSGGVTVDSGALFYRPDGSQSMSVGNRGVQLYDRRGGIIFAPDENSGIGLARPYLPMPVPQPTGTGSWPSTSATSWGGIAISDVYVQHPRVRWQASAYCPAGTTGQVQLMIGGTALGAVHDCAAGTFTTIDETVTVPSYAFLTSAQLVVNAQVTSGTGSVACQTYGLYGVQS